MKINAKLDQGVISEPFKSEVSKAFNQADNAAYNTRGTS
jgi:hypothetical protein